MKTRQWKSLEIESTACNRQIESDDRRGQQTAATVSSFCRGGLGEIGSRKIALSLELKGNSPIKSFCRARRNMTGRYLFTFNRIRGYNGKGESFSIEVPGRPAWPRGNVIKIYGPIVGPISLVWNKFPRAICFFHYYASYARGVSSKMPILWKNGRSSSWLKQRFRKFLIISDLQAKLNQIQFRWHDFSIFRPVEPIIFLWNNFINKNSA